MCMPCRYRNVFLACGIVVSILCAGAVNAGEIIRMTMAECITAALKESVAIHAAREGVSASEAGRNEAFTSFLPALRTSYSYTRLNEAPETGMPDLSSGVLVLKQAPIGTKDNYLWQIEAAQPLFTGGRIFSNYKIRESDVDAAHSEERRMVHETVLSTTEAYFELLKSERLLEVARQALQQLEAHQETARSFYEVGLIPKNDLLFAELEVADGQQNLVRAENVVQMSRARLNIILRRDVDTPVAVEDILQYEPFEKEFQECLQTGYENRPEVTYYSVRLEQAKRLVTVARSDLFPTLSVIGNYSRYGDTPGVSGSPYRDQEDWSVAGVAEWNFWEWGKTKFAVDAGLSRQNQASDTLSSMRDQITLEIKNSYLLMREAEKHIFVAQKAIERAEENYRINVERYREQVARSTDVVDAQTLMTKTKSDYYNALSDYNIARARLERSMGTNYTAGGGEAESENGMK